MHRIIFILMVVSGWLIVPVWAETTIPATDSWFDSFSVPGPAHLQYQPAWQDIPKSIGRYYSPEGPKGKYESHLLRKFTEGTISVKTGVDKKITTEDDADPFAGTGLVIKRVGNDYLILRLGAYNHIQVHGKIGGESYEIGAKPFPFEPGKTYRAKVELLNGHLKVWVDNLLYFDQECPMSTEPGKTGFYTESPAWFDDYQVTGLTSDQKKISGTPKLEQVYARFRGDRPLPGEAFSVHGSIDIFVRNTGEGPARLNAITVNGEAIDLNSQDSPVAWYEQRPWLIQPGEIGQLILRMRGLPSKIGDRVLGVVPGPSPKYRVTASWNGGVSATYQIPFRKHMEPFQVNFLAFSEDLKTVYVYLQNNDWLTRGIEKPMPVTRVMVGGQDVTDRITAGEKTLRGNVVPIKIDLEEPLEERRFVSVLAQTKDGTWTGHSLRAFPSRTILQVSVFAQWMDGRYSLGPRADWMEDIINHCANAIGVVGKYYSHLPRMKELGLMSAGLGSMVHGLAAWATHWEGSQKDNFPVVAAFWMDEVDKHPLAWNFRRWQEMKTKQRSEGKRPPLHLTNVMNPRSAEGPSFMEFPDAVMNAHGFGQGSGGLSMGFGRVEALPWRQFRMSRRPFYPYFRNAEIYPHLDPKTRTTTDLQENKRGFYRCMTGEEQRWMYYGALIHGAKGVFHWGYSGIRDKGGYGGDSLRLGLGGAGTVKFWNYTVRQEQVDMLQKTWDEIGRCNAEWRTIAPLIAISDVDTRSRIISCNPATLESGVVPLSTSTLISGLDAMVVTVVNHPTVKRGLSSLEPSSFDPVQTELAVDLPPWLTEYSDIFSVTYEKIEEVKPSKKVGNRIHFERTVKINDLIVIARTPGIKTRCEETLEEMKALLQKAYTSSPVHTDEPSPHKDWLEESEM